MDGILSSLEGKVSLSKPRWALEALSNTIHSVKYFKTGILLHTSLNTFSKGWDLHGFGSGNELHSIKEPGVWNGSRGGCNPEYKTCEKGTALVGFAQSSHRAGSSRKLLQIQPYWDAEPLPRWPTKAWIRHHLHGPTVPPHIRMRLQASCYTGTQTTPWKGFPDATSCANISLPEHRNWFLSAFTSI